MLEDILKKLDKWLTIKDNDFCPFKTKRNFCEVMKYKGRCVEGKFYESCPDYQINKEE